MSELTVYAAYYASDGQQWMPVGDDLNKIDILAEPYRIQCTAGSGEVLFTCELYADCEYQRPSEQFHQWAGADGEAFGLSFPTIDEADEMARHVEAILDVLRDSEVVARPVPPTSGAAAAQPIATGMPAPLKFPITRRELAPTDEGWRLTETQLRLTYPSRLRSGLHLSSVTELAKDQHVKEFEARYREFTVSDLWLAVNDVAAERAGREGLQALGASVLSLGVPLGVYLLDRDSLVGSARQMVLCKVVLARSMPVSESNLSGLREATTLPVGYQSYAITPSAQSTGTTELPTNRFEHLYLVPQPHLVIMTHAVKYEVQEPAVLDGIPGLELRSPAMSLLASHPEVLSSEDRDSIFAVCSPQPGRAHRDLSHAVDLSYQAMWDELNVLTKTQKQLEADLAEFRGSVGTFQKSSWATIQRLQDDIVKYLGHASQVLQVFRDRKFEVNRALSDIARFQELFLYTQKTCSVPELLCNWRHLHVMWDDLAQEIEFLSLQPPIDQSLMALTEKNKKMVSLKRSIALQDGLIERLSEMLDARGILQAEDLALETF